PYWRGSVPRRILGWKVIMGHYFFSHEPPIPMRYLDIAHQWYDFKGEAHRGGARAEKANYWLRLATALLFKLSGKM
ncbi:MAG: hypothetical protein QW815_05460, partial [Nitrososphaerota archaeon]